MSICSRTGKPHETLSGFTNGASKGQYKTNKACPYPLAFCQHIVEYIVAPTISFPVKMRENVQAAMPVGPKVSMEKPPPDHYLTHLPKHPGCKACMNCKVQRKHCRDQTKARQLQKVDTLKTEKTNLPQEIDNEVDTPKKFGDLISSDSIFAIKRSSVNPARHGNTTALVVRDRGTGWLAACPSKRKSAEDTKGAVNDFFGS